MTTTLAARPIKSVLAVFDHRRSGEDALQRAIELAQQAQAELVVLFVEDESLMRLAGLPFAHEIDRTSGIASRLDTQVLGRQLSLRVSRLSDRLNQLVSRSAREHQVRARVKVVRGRLAERALAASQEADVVFIDMFEKPSFPVGPAHMQVGARPSGGRSGAFAVPAITVIYDGSPTAARALHIAGEFAAMVGTDLVVALPPDSAGEGAQLREQAGELLSEYKAPVRFSVLQRTDIVGLRALIRSGVCGTLVVHANHPMLAGQAGRRLIEAVTCPIVLIR